jgi:hypothetical protein
VSVCCIYIRYATYDEQQYRLPKVKRSGRRFLVKFENESELKRVKKAAAKVQAALRKQMGKKFPNTSMYIAERALEAAEKDLGGE